MSKDAFTMQYHLKQTLYYFLASKLHLVFLALCCLFTNSFESFIYIYPFGALVLYRFGFNISKNDNAYKSIFLLKYYVNLLKKLREKA
ncbi:hypothetical protein [Campylobacter helveticus]|uniref:hypothetical protein n=1 Tax=Campylobacter helveticus TaxID=28898 RepID=UPI0022EB79B5|nr:hypothetical protein [Campylobacter helveticus]